MRLVPASCGFAILYATFIGILDREIVGGLDKATALVRPILSLFVGTIIAIPIELWVFQERIDQDLQRQYRQDNKEQIEQLRSAQGQLEQRRAGLQDQLTDLRKQEADWGRTMDDELVGRPKSGRSGIQGAGPVFENAKINRQPCVSVLRKSAAIYRMPSTPCPPSASVSKGSSGGKRSAWWRTSSRATRHWTG